MYFYILVHIIISLHRWLYHIARLRWSFLKPACANRLNQSDFLIWPNSLSQLSAEPKDEIMVIWNSNWTINTIDGQWTWCCHFYDCHPPARTAPNLLWVLPLFLFPMRAIHNFGGGNGAFWICLLLDGGGLFVSSGQ